MREKGVISAIVPVYNGLAFATGEYISFVDSDDYIHDTMLEKMITAMEK